MSLTVRIFKILMKALVKIISRIISLLPNSFSVFLGSRGWTNLIKQSPKVEFTAKLYSSIYKINVRGDFQVERMATKNRPFQYDPFLGLSQIDLDGKTAIDIGANIGSISIGLVALGCHKVYSIEPGPAHARLLDNIKLNKLDEVVIPYKIGLDSKSGELFWAEDKNNPGNAHLLKSLDEIDFKKIPTKFEQTEFIRVPVTTIDELFSKGVDGSIDIIKIDVEGMEWKVLSGGKDLIKSHLPIVVAETHRVASDMMRYDCMTPMFQFFYALGYRTFSLNDSNELIEFIYPNFGFDTFFIHEDNMGLVTF